MSSEKAIHIHAYENGHEASKPYTGYYVWSSFFENDEDIFVIKRTAMQLLAEFIGSQKIRFVGVGGLKTQGKRCETDAYYRFCVDALSS